MKIILFSLVEKTSKELFLINILKEIKIKLRKNILGGRTIKSIVLDKPL